MRSQRRWRSGSSTLAFGAWSCRVARRAPRARQRSSGHSPSRSRTQFRALSVGEGAGPLGMALCVDQVARLSSSSRRPNRVRCTDGGFRSQRQRTGGNRLRRRTRSHWMRHRSARSALRDRSRRCRRMGAGLLSPTCSRDPLATPLGARPRRGSDSRRSLAGEVQRRDLTVDNLHHLHEVEFSARLRQIRGRAAGRTLFLLLVQPEPPSWSACSTTR